MKLLAIAILLVLAGCQQNQAPPARNTMPSTAENVAPLTWSYTRPIPLVGGIDASGAPLLTTKPVIRVKPVKRESIVIGSRSLSFSDSTVDRGPATFEPAQYSDVSDANCKSPCITGAAVSHAFGLHTYGRDGETVFSAGPPNLKPFDNIHISGWIDAYSTNFKWTFRIDGQEYTLTGKELAEAVKAANYKVPAGCVLVDGKLYRENALTSGVLDVSCEERRY